MMDNNFYGIDWELSYGVCNDNARSLNNRNQIIILDSPRNRIQSVEKEVSIDDGNDGCILIYPLRPQDVIEDDRILFRNKPTDSGTNGRYVGKFMKYRVTV